MATQAKKRKTHKSPQRAQKTQEETSETNNGTITLSRKEKKRLKKANKLSKKGNGATNSVHVQRDWSDEEDYNEEDVNSPNNTPPEATNKTPNNEETEQPPDDDANSTPETVNTSTLTDNADTTHEPTNNNNNNNNNETALEPATLFSATLLEKILKPMFEQARQQQVEDIKDFIGKLETLGSRTKQLEDRVNQQSETHVSNREDSKNGPETQGTTAKPPNGTQPAHGQRRLNPTRDKRN
eukprot:g65391.t1